MYSNFQSIQILIALLKEYGIENIVLSPGGSDIPIIHSLECDNYFRCYSVVDERSAVYFGMGISQSVNKPVACVCTSGTAVSNYLPGMTEAFYQNIPIIAITADKNPYFNGQIETQKITQYGIFGEVSLKSVELPLCTTDDELWYCERVIKEALIISLFQGRGPIHINIPIVGSYTRYDIRQLPMIRRVNYISSELDDGLMASYIKELANAHKILIVVGQDIVFSEKDVASIEMFFIKYNCVISVEHTSNLNCNGCVFTYPVTETGNAKDETFVPDIVISVGNNICSYAMKPLLRNHNQNFKHYSIDESGRYRDVFKGITDIFHCSVSRFFEYFAKCAPIHISNDKIYYTTWKNACDRIMLADFAFSNFYVAQKLSTVIPEQAILHLAILNSTRVMQFFPLALGVRTYSNIGALGIDGCLSTFMGHAAVSENLVFCLIGDLSFFYDMNAVGIRHLGSNVRIILLNNGGGSEFHFFVDKKVVPTLNNFVCAEHTKTAKGWVESLGFKYFSASNKEEFNQNIDCFGKPSNAPLFMEVFTDMEQDAANTRDFYAFNAPDKSMKDIASGIKNRIFGKK